MQFVTKRNTPSIWTARRESGVGGWGYLRSVKGSNAFVTADALRELVKARELMPSLKIDEEMLEPCFQLISSQRRIQPNSEVESYSYDSFGSFQRIRDIRGDVGRLCSAELACLIYSDTFKVSLEQQRNQEHLAKALREWLKHRGILDKVKFPKGHADFSIAPWFWMYSYRTTLDAADYLTIDDDLQEKVRRTGLNAFFKHMKFYFEPKLGAKGWIIVGDLSKELHDSCQMLDGLATLKHLYQNTKVLDSADFGKIFRQLEGKEDKQTLSVIETRFNERLAEIKTIHQKWPLDALRYLEEMKGHFGGYPRLKELEKLKAKWRRESPELPSLEMLGWVKLGPFPGVVSKGLSDAEAWGQVLRPKDEKAQVDEDLLHKLDPTSHSVKGIFQTASGQLISPSTTYARLQLEKAPAGSYKFETEFTRINGDCMAVVFPVADASVVLVVSGWGGKVSGLAFVNGKDANRNPTTRDGKLENGVRHNLSLEVQLQENQTADIKVTLNNEPYISWKGPISALRPDRYWNLRDKQAIGIGGYNSRIVFHRCLIKELESRL